MDNTNAHQDIQLSANASTHTTVAKLREKVYFMDGLNVTVSLKLDTNTTRHIVLCDCFFTVYE